MSADKLTETGRRPLRKYGTELRDLAINIVNRLDEMREEREAGGDCEMIPFVENAIWNALFGYEATIPVDKRIAGLQRDLAEMEPLLREAMDYHGMCIFCGPVDDPLRGDTNPSGHFYNRVRALLNRIDARKAAQ